MDKDVIIVNETDPIDLICESFNSLPIKNFSWFNENSNNYEQLVIRDQESDVFKTILRITEIDESDNGSFECYLANEPGEDKVNFELLVQTTPKIDAIMIKVNEIESEVEDEVEVLENEEVAFDCLTDGFPTPMVKWFKNQDELEIAENETDFKIQKVNDGDVGNYQCLVVNLLGVASKTFKLIVNVPPKTDRIKENLRRVHEDSELSLECDIHGSPAPQIAWTFNGQPAKGKERILESNDQKLLTRQNVRVTDSGIYSCMGVNAFGSVTMMYMVTVNSIPKIILPNDEYHTARAGSDLTLSCDAIGSPQVIKFF